MNVQIPPSRRKHPLALGSDSRPLGLPASSLAAMPAALTPGQACRSRLPPLPCADPSQVRILPTFWGPAHGVHERSIASPLPLQFPQHVPRAPPTCPTMSYPHVTLNLKEIRCTKHPACWWCAREFSRGRHELQPNNERKRSLQISGKRKCELEAANEEPIEVKIWTGYFVLVLFESQQKNGWTRVVVANRHCSPYAKN